MLGQCLVSLYFKSTGQDEDIYSFINIAFVIYVLKGVITTIRNYDCCLILVRTHIQRQLMCLLKPGETCKNKNPTQELHLLQACPPYPHLYRQTEKTLSPYGRPFTGNGVSVPFNSVTVLIQH